MGAQTVARVQGAKLKPSIRYGATASASIANRRAVGHVMFRRVEWRSRKLAGMRTSQTSERSVVDVKRMLRLLGGHMNR